jgi:hypothetical protein
MQKLKIIIIMLFALVIVKTSSGTIFIANSPRINKAFIASLITPQKETITVKEYRQLPDSALNRITAGVYAKEDKANNVIYIRVTDDVEYDERIIEVNGQQTRVRFPKGTFK